MLKKHLLVQYLTPHHFVSWWMGKFVSLRFKPLVRWQIGKFIRTYGVDLSQAVKSNVSDYKTFNEFFTRRLKPECRPIQKTNHALLSPADGFISQAGKIEHDQLLQAKGIHYSLSQLLTEKHWADTYQNGDFMTIYLSPKDYHRVHMPFAAELKHTTYVPGRLFSVNPKTTGTIPNIFTRNERLICHFETRFGPIAIILVGAMLVNGICTSWDGKVTPFKKLKNKAFKSNEVILNQGDELGYFEFGSTVILLFPKNTINWSENAHFGNFIQMGKPIADLKL